ncbi:MAG: c-type cytochrome [Gammaproteobacteria bacterium]|nr:c-type cytochrome [Gammaproteobacteria bacterium]
MIRQHCLIALVFAATLAQAGDDLDVDEVAFDRGRRLYAENCAACHGVDARGDGLVARVLTKAVPDLTALSSGNDGAFPKDRVYRVIDGRTRVVAHGSRLMPVWGTEFWLDEGADERADVMASERVHALIAYLQTIQEDE